jgi:glycosyltransferase involved in cell wall biosynthesis
MSKFIEKTEVRTVWLSLGRKGASARIVLEISSVLNQVAPTDFLLVSTSNELFVQILKANKNIIGINTFSSIFSFAIRSFVAPFVIFLHIRTLKKKGFSKVVILMHHVWNPFVLFVCFLMKMRVVFLAHDANLHPGEENFLDRIVLLLEIKFASVVATLSRYVAETVIEKRASKDVYVLEHPPLSYSSNFQTRKSTSQVRFLIFGRVRKYKGIIEFIDAWSAANFDARIATLDIVGEFDDECRHRLQGIDISSNVFITDSWIGDHEIGSIIDCCDAAIFPYIEASQSGVLPLLQSAGVPCIVSPVGGLIEQVDHRLSLISTSSKVEDLIASVETFIGTHRKLPHFKKMSNSDIRAGWSEFAAALKKL